MLDTARTEYDVILIDCPPAELVADTSIISKVADSTLFVIRANFVDKEVIPAIEAYYKEKKFNNMSIVLNGISKTNSYSGYDRYGYNYGYGHRKAQADREEQQSVESDGEKQEFNDEE